MHRRAIIFSVITATVPALPAAAQSPTSATQPAAVPGYRYVAPEDVVAPNSLEAPAKAFEVGVSTGYTQPFGSLHPEQNISDIVGPGFGAGLDLAFRWSPRFSIGWSGQYQESAVNNPPPSGYAARGYAMQLGFTYHAFPYDLADPYVQLGSGVRWLWEVPGQGPVKTTVAAEVLRAQIGLDYRMTRDVAIGPYLGLDINVNDTVNSYFSAGLFGRFDVGGKREQHVLARVPGYWEATVPPQPAAPPAPPPAAAPEVVEEPKAEPPPDEAPKSKDRKTPAPSKP